MNRRARIRFCSMLVILGLYLFGCGGGTHVGPPPKQALNPNAVPILLCEWNTGNFGTTHISRDGSKVAVVHDFKIEVYDTHTCQQLWQQPFGPADLGILDFTASEDLNTVAILYESPNGTKCTKLEIYDTSQKQLVGLRERCDNGATLSPSGNYLVVYGGDWARGEGNEDEALIMLLNRAGEKLWEGNRCVGYPLDISLSYDAEFVTCDMDVYDRSGNFLWQAAPNWADEPDENAPATSYEEIATQISPNGQFAAFSFVGYTWGTGYTRYHFQLRNISGQTLWDKNMPIFDMRFTDDATRLLGLEVDGVFMFNQQGNQLWHFNPGYEQAMMDKLVDMSSNGLVVVAILYPPRDWQQSGDLVGGLTPTTHTAYVINGLTGAVLWQNSFGDMGLSVVEVSGDGLTLLIGGNNLLRTYDLTPIVQPLSTGGRVPPPGGSLSP